MYYVIFFVMAIIIVLLAVKICVMRQSAKEITSAFSTILHGDTNMQIGISSRDRTLRTLAAELNRELTAMREMQLHYEHGNTELNTAVTNISHDLRTPLTAICGYLDMMQKTDDSEKQAHYLAIIKERTDMMKHLTEELFRYSVIATDASALGTEPVFVNQLLAESIGSFYPALTGRGIAPDIQITEKRIERNLNKAALSRVFSNLLNNAVKYSDGDLCITLSDSGEITFSNTAKGLSAVEAEQLFDRFYTVESAHHSTGLGLSIARTLTERMGGTISADYTGNRLTIRLNLP